MPQFDAESGFHFDFRAHFPSCLSTEAELHFAGRQRDLQSWSLVGEESKAFRFATEGSSDGSHSFLVTQLEWLGVVHQVQQPSLSLPLLLLSLLPRPFLLHLPLLSPFYARLAIYDATRSPTARAGTHATPVS